MDTDNNFEGFYPDMDGHWDHKAHNNAVLTKTCFLNAGGYTVKARSEVSIVNQSNDVTRSASKTPEPTKSFTVLNP